jgi:tetratricopeptide (TPR) repeat protein
MDALTTYSTSDVARILQVPEPRVRIWARMGGIVPSPGPDGHLEFTFQQLVLLRTTRGLIEAGVPARRVKRIWSTLKRQISDDLPLTSIRILADGDRAIAWDGKAPWQPDSGQFVLDFAGGDVVGGGSEAPLFEVISDDAESATPSRDAAEAARFSGKGTAASGEAASREGAAGMAASRKGGAASGVSGAAPRKGAATSGTASQKDSAPAVISIFRGAASARPDTPLEEEENSGLSAEQWFRLGSEMESASPIEARQAYTRALDADPDYADAHLNLGRLDHRAGDLASAEARYRRAIQCAPEDATAHFNLAALLEDRNCPHAAAEEYERAIACDADSADAHYNLGLLLEKLGQRADAMRHLMAAHRLYAQ